MKVLLRDTSCYVDIGTHRGELLRHVVRIAPHGRHYAFEPIPVHASYLRTAYPNVLVHEVALSDFTGTSEFHFVTNASAYSGLKARIYDRPDPKIELLKVQVATLDSYVSPQDRVDLIKIDVEGGEYHVLKGASNTINRCRPLIVFEAGPKSTGQYGVTPGDVFNLLNSNNYALTTMHRWLNRLSPYSGTEFEQVWEKEIDYYFLASPKEKETPG